MKRIDTCKKQALSKFLNVPLSNIQTYTTCLYYYNSVFFGILTLGEYYKDIDDYKGIIFKDVLYNNRQYFIYVFKAINNYLQGKGDLRT